MAVSLIDVGNKVVVDVVCDIVIVAVADIGVGVSGTVGVVGSSVVEYLIVVAFVGITVGVLRMFVISVDFVPESFVFDTVGIFKVVGIADIVVADDGVRERFLFDLPDECGV